jgi:hypothetical protein
MRRATTAASIVLMSAAVMALASATPAFAVTPNVYNSIPSTLPGNIPSIGFEATQSSEFGDMIKFAPGTSSTLKAVRVVMSSWACEQGAWQNNNCVTTPGAKFSIPITFSIYQANAGDPPTRGTVISSVTKVFNIPYRPTASVQCTGDDLGKWYSTADATCYNGLANKIVFKFTGLHVTLPTQAIYGVAYNTSGYGDHPEGYSNTCNGAPEGCPYDALNVGAAAGLPSRGFDLYPDGVFYDSDTASNYCDGGTLGTGTFRLDDGCWTGYNPLVRFTVKAA